MMSKRQTLKLGVLAGRGEEQARQMWQPTADYLTDEIPGYAFVIVPLQFPQIHQAVIQGEVDFLIPNSGIYVELEAKAAIHRIATRKHLRMGKAYTVFGGVIFCRRDRDDISQLSDLKGKRFMAADQSSLGGWRMAWREIKQAGINPYRDFLALICSSGTQDAVLYSVRDGLVDAGTVSTHVLEEMTAEGKINVADFKVINQQTAYEPEFPFALSTRLYPEWPFAVVKHTPAVLAEQVAIALLKMPPDSLAAKVANAEGWTIPLNYEPVHECFKELQVEPYQEFGKIASSFELAVKGSNDGLWDWNLETNEVFYSSRWKEMLGLEGTEIKNHVDEWKQRIHPEDYDQAIALIQTYLEGKIANYELEHRLRHQDGSYRWILSRGLLLRDVQGKPYRMAGSNTDISDRKQVELELWNYKEHLEELVAARTVELTQANKLLQQEIVARCLAEEKLRHDALHDPLTGLANRTLFMERLTHLIELAKQRHDYLFAVLFVDLDRFKLINDSLGHLVGDQLLIAIAKRLSERIRPLDTVARLGGDEFAILLENIQDFSMATVIAERLQKELENPFYLENQEVFISASIGINFSTHPQNFSLENSLENYAQQQKSSGTIESFKTPYERPEDLLRDADAAMYHAKSQGKARYAIFNQVMYQSSLKQWQLENDLRRAIERQELQIYYQPIVSLKTGVIAGFEALIRWRHPQRGLLYPREFLAIAEDTGLLIPIGWSILRQGCDQLHQWQAAFPAIPPLFLSFNLSSKQLRQSKISEKIANILQETGIDASGLKLEIAENSFMENWDELMPQFHQLKTLGLQLYIDNFGTGYSSLSRLHEFPIDALKIDHYFVNRILFDEKSATMLRSMMTLARQLEIHTIVEGVETSEQLALLRSLHCEYGQGCFFSPPMESQAIWGLLSNECALSLRECQGHGHSTPIETPLILP